MKQIVKVNDSDASPFIEQKDVILCRSGIQLYHKSEVEGFITEDNKPAIVKDWYKEYRPANVIVKAQDLFRSLPVTKEHPDVWVDSKNFNELAGGTLDKEISVVALDGESEGEIGLKSNITFYTDELYNYYLNNKEVSVGYKCKKHFVDNPEELGYDIVLDEITEVNHLAITRAGRGGSSVAVIDSIIGGMKPMRTGIFAFLKNKKQAVNDSNFSFGKTVLEAVKNSKGTTEAELEGEMKGVLDSMKILKDCEAKNKLMDVVKDCFDNKDMAIAEEEELTATLDSMWFDIHGDSLTEMAKEFKKLAKSKGEAKEGDTQDSEPEENKDSEPEGDENKDSKDEGKEGEEEDSKDKDGEEKDSKDKDSKDKDSKDKDKEDKDSCNKDSAIVASIMDSLKAEMRTLVADTVKECLGIKDDKAKIEGGVVDSGNTGSDVALRDYNSFLE